MSKILEGMRLLISAFHSYSAKEGDKHTLSKGEVKDLLNTEMKDILGKSSDQAALDQIFKALDADKDGSVDFQEYVIFVASIMMLCEECLSKK